MLCFTTGCNNKKVEPADSAKADPIATTDTTDTVDSVTRNLAETPMPKAADQLFDDFFFNFIANKKVATESHQVPVAC